MHRQICLFLLAFYLLSGCVSAQRTPSSATSTSTAASPSATLTYNGIILPQPKDSIQPGAPLPAWLISRNEAIPANFAAFNTGLAHIDPALTSPNISTTLFPIGVDRVILIIGPGQITKLKATVVPWRGTVIPLFNPDAQSLKVDTVSSNGINVFSILLSPMTTSGSIPDQLLQVHTTFPVQAIQGQPSSGEAFYVWRLQFPAK